ncbi:MAG: xylose isomerase protein [Thermomicrobiales bacterium]|jgi:D-psicose/D-tagatose/L-ribulose 3-epimerase|nr:xylose isomerase protein [Thermomicrobiales bacterium]
MNPIGVNAWVWVSPPTDESITAIAPRVKAMGFDVLELGLENPGDWDPARMAEVFAANDLGATVCAAMGPGRDLTDPDTVASTQDYLRACIDAVVALGGNVVAGPIYTPVGKTWQMDTAERAATIDRLLEGLKPLADYAGERSATLGIEPLNRFETSLLNTAEQTMEVVDRLDSPAVGVLLDTFHMNIEEKDQSAAIRLVGDKLVHFHACGSDRGAPGADHIAWDAIAAALGDIGYTGPLVIESFTPDNQTIARAAAIWRPLAESQEALAEEGLAFLRERFG